MHATITVKVCSWSSLATEFPCNHEDSNQSWPRQPLHWSLKQHRPTWGSAPLWYCCVLGWSLSKCMFTSTAPGCQAPDQHLWILHLQGHVSGYSWCVQQPALLLSSFFFHIRCLFFSDHHISCFSPIYWNSSFHFPLFVLLHTQILLTLVLLSYRERQHRTKGPLNCEICCPSC